jgi:cation/acetate symporter
MVGIVASLVLIAFSPELYTLYGLNPLDAPIPLNNPGIISIPLSFMTLIGVSLLTAKAEEVKTQVGKPRLDTIG